MRIHYNPKMNFRPPDRRENSLEAGAASWIWTVTTLIAVGAAVCSPVSIARTGRNAPEVGYMTALVLKLFVIGG